MFGNNDIDLLKIKTKCDICKRTFLRLELHLTAIPGFGCEMCDECFEKFIEKVIKPGTPRDRNIQMKIDPSSYEEAMKSLKIPSDDWITNQLSGEGRWWDITMLVNKERYIKFIENAGVIKMIEINKIFEKLKFSDYFLDKKTPIEKINRDLDMFINDEAISIKLLNLKDKIRENKEKESFSFSLWELQRNCLELLDNIVRVVQDRGRFSLKLYEKYDVLPSIVRIAHFFNMTKSKLPK